MGDKADLDAIVTEVVAEGHVRPDELRPEERAYLKEHALKKPLRVLDIWALGVGVVITGAYFGWNLGLKDGGLLAGLRHGLVHVSRVPVRDDRHRPGHRRLYRFPDQPAAARCGGR